MAKAAKLNFVSGKGPLEHKLRLCISIELDLLTSQVCFLNNVSVKYKMKLRTRSLILTRASTASRRIWTSPNLACSQEHKKRKNRGVRLPDVVRKSVFGPGGNEKGRPGGLVSPPRRRTTLSSLGATPRCSLSYDRRLRQSYTESWILLSFLMIYVSLELELLHWRYNWHYSLVAAWNKWTMQMKKFLIFQKPSSLIRKQNNDLDSKCAFSIGFSSGKYASNYSILGRFNLSLFYGL